MRSQRGYPPLAEGAVKATQPPSVPSVVDLMKQEMLLALEAYERFEDKRANCSECGGERESELCEKCFPFADDARLRIRAALDQARGETKYGTWRPPEFP